MNFKRDRLHARFKRVPNCIFGRPVVSYLANHDEVGIVELIAADDGFVKKIHRNGTAPVEQSHAKALRVLRPHQVDPIPHHLGRTRSRRRRGGGRGGEQRSRS